MEKRPPQLHVVKREYFSQQPHISEVLAGLIEKAREDHKEVLLEAIIDRFANQLQAKNPEEQRWAVNCIVREFDRLWAMKFDPQEPVQENTDIEPTVVEPTSEEQHENVLPFPQFIPVTRNPHPVTQAQEYTGEQLNQEQEITLEYEVDMMIRLTWDSLLQAHQELTKENRHRSMIGKFLHRKVDIQLFTDEQLERVSTGLDTNTFKLLLFAVYDEFYRCLVYTTPHPPEITTASILTISMHIDVASIEEGYEFTAHPTLDEQLSAAGEWVASVLEKTADSLRKLFSKKTPTGQVLPFRKKSPKRTEKPVD